jgi:hypothetical protein
MTEELGIKILNELKGIKNILLESAGCQAAAYEKALKESKQARDQMIDKMKEINPAMAGMFENMMKGMEDKNA